MVDHALIDVKSKEQLAGYSDSAFLFREPAYAGVHGTSGHPVKPRGHLPIGTGAMDRGWFRLLQAFEKQLAVREQLGVDGGPIRLVASEDPADDTTFFPLHSLRVSLITALALDGGIEFPLLQKLVGHSRLVMTLYYTKPGAARMQAALADGLERLEKGKAQSIGEFVQAATVEQLRNEAATNDLESVLAALKEAPGNRNPAGWMPLHIGLCPVGGNTGEISENNAIAGCHNGGEVHFTQGGRPRYGPVPGGARNCVRCRWFITEPRYIPALVAHFNNLSYHLHEAQTKAIDRESALQALKSRRFECEQSGTEFTDGTGLLDAERQAEGAIKDLEDCAQSLLACHRLVQRCWAIHRARLEEGEGGPQAMALVATGSEGDVSLVLQGTDSELLQLSGVCSDAEIYPDLNPGKAVLQRSALLDMALMRDNIRPHFFSLTEDQQLVLGNEFIRRLAREFSPLDSTNGHDAAIRLLEDGRSLSSLLGCSIEDLQNFVPTLSEPRKVFPIALPPQTPLNASGPSA